MRSCALQVCLLVVGRITGTINLQDMIQQQLFISCTPIIKLRLLNWTDLIRLFIDGVLMCSPAAALFSKIEEYWKIWFIFRWYFGMIYIFAFFPIQSIVILKNLSVFSSNAHNTSLNATQSILPCVGVFWKCHRTGVQGAELVLFYIYKHKYPSFLSTK